MATAKSLSLMYGKPEVSCNSLVDMYLGKQSASLMKEFYSFCNLVITMSETVIVEITPKLLVTYLYSTCILHVLGCCCSRDVCISVVQKCLTDSALFEIS